MSNRRAVKTLDNEIMNPATRALATGGETGPLGALEPSPFTGMRNELPFDQNGGYEPTEEDRLNAVLSEVGNTGAGGFVSIFKLNHATKTWEFTDRRTVAEFENEGLPYLARTYGAGDYEMRIYNSDKKIHARPKVTISQAAEQNAQPKTAPAGSEITQLAKIMTDGLQGIATLIAQGQRQQPAGQSRAEMLQEMIQMQTLFSGGKSADPIDTMTKMFGLIKTIMPRAPGDENPFLELVDKFAPIVMESMSNAKNNQAALPAPPGTVVAVPPAQPPQQPRPILRNNQPANPQQAGAAAMSMQVKMQLIYLCTQAARDSDPGPYASIIVDQLPREVLDGMINDANWLDSLAAIHPGVKKFPDWFEDLKTDVIEELEQQSAESLTSGNDGDIQPGTNAGAGDVSSGSSDTTEQ